MENFDLSFSYVENVIPKTIEYPRKFQFLCHTVDKNSGGQKIFHVYPSQLISMKRLVGSENDFNGIYFHHHFYIKAGVKSL